MFYREEKVFNYTKMSNYHLKDKNLSLKAKGLFSIILSLPDNWKFSNEGLCSICKEGKMAVDNAVFAYINRLRKETGGYICHKCLSFCIRKFFKFCSVNRIVLTDIYIISIFGDREIGTIWNIRERLIFR